MKITLLAVSSLDGFLTRGNESNHYEWASRQDFDYFFSQIESAETIFMGSKTYESARRFMKSKEGRIRVVFTRNLEKYAKDTVPGFLEFTDKSIRDTVKKYEKLGKKEALLVGGPELQTQFLKEKLVDEIHITIEPKIFGAGKRLVTHDLELNLQLLSSERLNDQGTLLLKYKVSV